MVYLIHFSRKFHHSRHYIGFTDDLQARMKRHEAGHGAALLRAVTRAGIKFGVVRVWNNGDKTFERMLKKKKQSSLLCPICIRIIQERKGKRPKRK